MTSVIADLDIAHPGGAENHLGAGGIIDDEVAVVDPADDDGWFTCGDEGLARAVWDFFAGFDDGDMGGVAFMVQGRSAEQYCLVFAAGRRHRAKVIVVAIWVCVIEPHQEAPDHQNHATTTQEDGDSPDQIAGSPDRLLRKRAVYARRGHSWKLSSAAVAPMEIWTSPLADRWVRQ